MATTKPITKLEVGKKYNTRDGRVVTIIGENAAYSEDSTGRWGGLLDGWECSWRYDGHFFPMGESPWDLIEEIVEDTPPAYRYFRYRDYGPGRGPNYLLWRAADGDAYCEATYPELEGDPWELTTVSLSAQLNDSCIIECDEHGEPLAQTLAFRTTGYLSPASYRRIAKLAARITLADGPVFTPEELAGMTIGELVARLEETPCQEIYSV